MTLEQERDKAWAEYEAGYNAARQEAIDEMICFCRCGCRNPVTQLYLGSIPNRCDACQAGAGRDHAVMPQPAESFDWARYEEPRVVSTPGARKPHSQRLRKVGTHVRAKATERMRALRAVEKSAEVDHRGRKRIPLTSVVIPETVKAGSYAVEDDYGDLVEIVVRRPRSAAWRGFVFVEIRFADDVVQTGMQPPQPYKATWAQPYQGPSVHLVHRLVADPDKARAAAVTARQVERDYASYIEATP